MDDAAGSAAPRYPAVLLLGPTGSGKTPLGDVIQRRGLAGMRCLHFDFGARLREVAGSQPVGHPRRRCVDSLGPGPPEFSPDEIEFLRRVLNSGALLEDEHFPIARRILRSFMAAHGADPEACVVLNGLPRHLGQAQAIDAMLDVRLVVHLQCSAETVLRRLQTNVGGDRAARTDDDLESVGNKLAIFGQRTAPLLDYYRRHGARIETVEVTAGMTPEQMWQRLASSLGGTTSAATCQAKIAQAVENTDDWPLREWLEQSDPARLDGLWRAADDARHRNVGDRVHLRALLEISNWCVRRCVYCGINAANHALPRYRMSSDEIVACVNRAVGVGYGTVVIQAGEDPGITLDWMADLVRRIKSETPLAVTLSLGERGPTELAAWRRAGADRYLLRFETSDRDLYERIHPPRANEVSDRLALLQVLRDLDYELGSGVMVGIPGQTYEGLARDIEWFVRLGLDMIGVGPYVPHPHTPMGEAVLPLEPADPCRVPATEEMTCKVIALARLRCPGANIPSTTALATVNRSGGYERGLRCGANVVMVNLTPPEYRRLYEIYPNKAGVDSTETPGGCSVEERIRAMGRTVATGRGDSPSYLQRSGRRLR